MLSFFNRLTEVRKKLCRYDLIRCADVWCFLSSTTAVHVQYSREMRMFLSEEAKPEEGHCVLCICARHREEVHRVFCILLDVGEETGRGEIGKQAQLSAVCCSRADNTNLSRSA